MTESKKLLRDEDFVNSFLTTVTLTQHVTILSKLVGSHRKIITIYNKPENDVINTGGHGDNIATPNRGLKIDPGDELGFGTCALWSETISVYSGKLPQKIVLHCLDGDNFI